MEMFFFIKPYVDVKLKRINFFKKKSINKLFVQKKISLIFNNFWNWKRPNKHKFIIYSFTLNLNTIEEIPS